MSVLIPVTAVTLGTPGAARVRRNELDGQRGLEVDTSLWDVDSTVGHATIG